MHYDTTLCCGVDEFNGLNGTGTPQKAMKDFIIRYDVHGIKCAHITFTEARKIKKSTPYLYRSWWPKLEKYIKRNGLGQITSGPWKKNPNTGNSVRVHIVTPNITALKVLFAKEITQAKEYRFGMLLS